MVFVFGFYIINWFSQGEVVGYFILCKGWFDIGDVCGYVFEDFVLFDVMGEIEVLRDVGVLVLKIEGC